ncbi:MAG: hypothetical protein D6733_06765, partial [Methanobacteriota archaeon]
MRALLIDAQGAGVDGRAFVEWIPAGLRAVAGILEARGIEYDIIFVERFLEDPGVLKGYDVVMATGMSSDFEMIRAAGRRVKEAGRPFLVGGPVTFDPEAVVREAGADIAVIGEGERSFAFLLDAGLKDGVLPDTGVLREVDGIAYPGGEGVVARMPAGYLSKEELERF